MRTTLLWLGLLGCGGPEPGSSPMIRLTPAEYNRTIRDLYGFDDDWPWLEPAEYEDEFDEDPWPWRFPADIPIHGFDGMAEGQVASGYLVEQYQAAASHFAPFALIAPTFWTCADREACAEDSVVRLAHRAWRRPLTDDERARLVAFHRAQVAQWGVASGTELAVQGILQSPQFLFRMESGELDAFELASRLSYFLWDSMPDAELFEAAARGRLDTRAGVERQARRMLADPRARAAVVRWHRQWLGLDDVFANRASFDAYGPQYGPEAPDDEGLQDAEEVWSSFLIGAQAAMVREAELFVERTVFDGGGTLAALLTDNHGYATQFESFAASDTFRLYGVTSDDVLPVARVREMIDDGNLGYDMTFVPVTFPADQRAGILTLGATLAARSHPVHPAPVLRGVFVLERLACEHIGQPPEEAVLQAPPDTLAAASTNRERLQAITGASPCNACHDVINPVGFAFESFDSLGGWRDTDNGSSVDPSGVLDLTREPPVPFANAVELAARLAESDQVHDCYARTWAQTAFGADLADADPSLATIQQRFRTGHRGDVRELLIDIATSDAFRFRKTEDSE